MGAIKNKLNKPYYVFRPGQVARRTLLPLRRPGLYDEITLPWGLPLRFRAREQTGLCYARRGIFDLPVCEALWRLSDAGERALDVGANIGQMTSLLAVRLGAGGNVISFEPHPAIFKELSANVRRWQAATDVAAIELRNTGLGPASGTGELSVGPAFDWNMGSASLVADQADDGRGDTIAIEVRRLDEVLSGIDVGVMKLDVEGYESRVLEGAERLLAERRVRDIVFEEFDAPPTAATRLLEAHGYEVFALDQGLFGPHVGELAGGAARRSGEDPSYLATLDPPRALARLAPRGWSVLGVGPGARRERSRSRRRRGVVSAAR